MSEFLDNFKRKFAGSGAGGASTATAVNDHRQPVNNANDGNGRSGVTNVTDVSENMEDPDRIKEQSSKKHREAMNQASNFSQSGNTSNNGRNDYIDFLTTLSDRGQTVIKKARSDKFEIMQGHNTELSKARKDLINTLIRNPVFWISGMVDGIASATGIFFPYLLIFSAKPSVSLGGYSFIIGSFITVVKIYNYILSTVKTITGTKLNAQFLKRIDLGLAAMGVLGFAAYAQKIGISAFGIFSIAVCIFFMMLLNYRFITQEAHIYFDSINDQAESAIVINTSLQVWYQVIADNATRLKEYVDYIHTKYKAKWMRTP